MFNLRLKKRNNVIKKIFPLTFATSLFLSLIGCGKQENFKNILGASWKDSIVIRSEKIDKLNKLEYLVDDGDKLISGENTTTKGIGLRWRTRYKKGYDILDVGFDVLQELNKPVYFTKDITANNQNPEIFVGPQIYANNNILSIKAYIFADPEFLKREQPITAFYGEENLSRLMRRKSTLWEKLIDKSEEKLNVKSEKLKFKKIKGTELEAVGDYSLVSKIEKISNACLIYGNTLKWDYKVKEEFYPILILQGKNGKIIMESYLTTYYGGLTPSKEFYNSIRDTTK